MTTTFRVDQDVPIEMRDGVLLRADILRPNDAERHPAILYRSYGKGRVHPLRYELVEAGYAFVNSDLRGRGASGGEWDPSNNFVVEGPDGHDSIEWIAAQRWCDGNVGMFGISHATCFQWMAALEQPPHLRAIAPWSGDFNEMFVPPLTGGAISLLTTLLWLPNEAADAVNRLERQGKDVAEMRQVLAWARSNPDEVAYYLPFVQVPLARHGRLRQLLDWRLQPISQPELQAHRRYEHVAVPCFSECGWYDGAAWSEFENFNAMRQRGGTERARQGQHLIAGPWQHAATFQSNLGDLSFGYTADTAGSGIHAFQIQFYDKYVRGRDIDLPTIRYFVMGKNEWRTAETWPLPQTDWQRFYLHSRGNANTGAGDGILSRDEAGSEPPDLFIYNPHDPVPTVGGSLIGALTAPGYVPGPVEQSRVECRHDVLCFTTPELTTDLQVTGPLQLHLFAATSACDTDFAAKVVHVYPDGRAYNLSEGIVRASGREFGNQKELVAPGEIVEYVITLGQTSQFFRRGSRIRLDVTSSNFPQFDRNMNTGNPIGTDTLGVPALQTIYHEVGFASYIDLPVISV